MSRGMDWWHQYFIGLAEYASRASKDPSTQTGAVIVGPNKAIVSMGFNGFPSKMPDNPEWYQDRNEKYSRIVHCEMNALLFANQPVVGCTLYTYPAISCDRCVVHMIQAGITKFVAPKPTDDMNSRWADAFERTRRYIKECECVVLEI